jgi:hypothetical protein
MDQKGDPMITSTTTASSSKASRQLLGTLPGPITGTKVYSKMGNASDFNGKEPVSFVVLTPDQRMIRATTYGGNLGKRFSLGDHNSGPIPADKDLARALKGYSEVTDAAILPGCIVLATTDLPQDQA